MESNILYANELFDDLRVFCRNLGEAEEIFQEIFLKEEYKFVSDSPSPYILDCGSHVGFSVLYFKKKYPNSRIVAFEPDPANFELLKENIKLNRLTFVDVHNLAISGRDGHVKLFGEFNLNNPRTSGNSTLQGWANPGSNAINVESTRLSKYIIETVDFLKLDIEGAESDVIEEISDKLPLIKALCIEFHEVNNDEDQKLQQIQSVLVEHGFVCEVEHKLLENVFPAHLLKWAKNSGFVLAVIKASRRSE